MAFSKAPVKRFNDFNENDASAPPPGSYNPLFITDVGNSGNGSMSRLPRSVSRNTSPAPSTLRRIPSPSPSRGSNFLQVPDRPQSHFERCRPPMPGLQPNFLKGGNTASDKLVELELKYQEAEKQLKEIQKENAEIQTHLSKLQEDKNDWVKTAESCQVTIKELNASLQDLKIQLEKSEANEDATTEAFEKAEQQWKVKTANLQDSIKELQTSLVNHVQKHSELENLLKLTEKENQILEADRLKMAQNLEEEQSAVEASEKKCQLLEESMAKCYAVCQERMDGAQEEKEKWQEVESELMESLRVSKCQIDSLKIAVQAEKAGRIHSEGKVAGLLESLEKSQNTINTLRAGWEVKEKELMNEIQTLQTCIKSYIDNPMTLLDESGQQTAKELLEQKKRNAELRSKIDILERLDSIQKQGLEIDLASALHSEGIDQDSIMDVLEILDVASPLEKKSTLPDITSSEDLKNKVNELKASVSSSAKYGMDADELQATQNLIAHVEADNEKKRQCISLFTQDLENGNDKRESSTSLDGMNNFRTAQSSSDEKWVPGGGMSNLALGPTPATTNLNGTEKSPSSPSEGLVVDPSPRGSCGKLFGPLKLDPIAEEEEDKHK